MIIEMPEFMKTKEWKEFKDYDGDKCESCLKPGAPEWLVKAFDEFKKQVEDER
ncbi:hypothetical protein AGMMS50212_16430 [Spirochaetia bacterium]|nr:hypothetical protein AGMMS50212_16430 [Spirochaetia bacterium]